MYFFLLYAHYLPNFHANLHIFFYNERKKQETIYNYTQKLQDKQKKAPQLHAPEQTKKGSAA